MKTLVTVMMAMAVAVTQALAAGGGTDEGIGLLATILIGFGAMIIVFQLIPGIMLLGGMLKGLFTWTEKEAHNV